MILYGSCLDSYFNYLYCDVSVQALKPLAIALAPLLCTGRTEKVKVMQTEYL